MNMLKDKYRAEGFLLGTIVGALIAGITALLFAPKSGKELREDISNQAHDAKDKGIELKDTASEYGSEYWKNAQETFDNAKSKVESNIKQSDSDLDSIKKTARETADSLKEEAKKGTERDKEITEAAIDDVTANN